MNKKKLYGTLIAVISFAIIVIGATFAFLVLSSNATNGSYNISTACFDMLKEEGADINATLNNSSNALGGLHTYVLMGINNNCNISANGQIFIDVKNTTSSILYAEVPSHCENPSNLVTLYNYTNSADCTTNNGIWVTDGTALKYAIYSTETPTSNTVPLSVGYITTTGNIKLYEAPLSSGSLDTYYIYFWLDGELTDESYNIVSFQGNIKTIANQNAGPSSSSGAIDNEVYTVSNSAMLAYGLIPVKLSIYGNAVTTVAENDPTWYDYDNKQWANAILVNENTHSRGYYKNHPGTEVPLEDILAYYVWIPRYSYQVWAYSGSNAAGDPHQIPIKFVDTSTIETASAIGDWHTHPAFWWDKDSDGVREAGEELSGIWIGKFEISHATLGNGISNSMGYDSGTTICNSTACDNYVGLRILPDKSSLTNNRLSNFFYASRFMESNDNPFGLLASQVDSHVMKNSEWGAAAYLSHSQYGINTQINDNATGRTGRGKSSDPNYGTGINYLQSSTGNVTGVFDMSGGYVEYAMANYNNAIGSSGFSAMPAAKYYNKYTVTNITQCTFVMCGGHALHETKQWYGDGMQFFISNATWLRRGGSYSWVTQTVNGAFYLYYGAGNNDTSNTTRLVLISDISE